MYGQGRLPAWMGHPLVGFVAMIVGIAGVILAVLFYYKSRVERQPFFYVESARNIIVNRELAVGEKLSVSFEGQPTGAVNITAMQCYFWNAGRGSIRESDILLPMRLVLQQGTEILDAGVLRQTRPSVVDFRISPDRTPDGKRTNTATVTFKILEKEDGAALQILYVGGPDATVNFEGTVEGAELRRLIRPFERWVSAETGKPPKSSDVWKNIKLFLSFSAFWPLVWVLLDMVTYLPKTGGVGSLRLTFEPLRGWKFWVFETIWIVALGLGYYYLFLLHPEVPFRLLS